MELGVGEGKEQFCVEFQDQGFSRRDDKGEETNWVDEAEIL
jgi:hypothetical protein